jgi:hypothetical protein
VRRAAGAVLRHGAYPMYTLISILQQIAEVEYTFHGSAIGKRRLDLTKILPYKRSDTLAVLGSGASVNSLNSDDWDRIKSVDSVGLNFWILHEFVPTYYVFEPPRRSQSEDALLKTLAWRSNAYRGTPMIAKNVTRRSAERIVAAVPGRNADQLLFAADFEIPGKTRDELTAAVKMLDRWGFLTPSGRGRMHIPKKRASLSFLMFLGAFLGYKHILLYGVDLNATEYFFQSPTARLWSERPLIPDVAIPGKVHRTYDADIDAMTIDAVVDVIKQEFFRPLGIELFVGSTSSALYPKLRLVGH